jgi:hypothetical protein
MILEKVISMCCANDPTLSAIKKFSKKPNTIKKFTKSNTNKKKFTKPNSQESKPEVEEHTPMQTAQPVQPKPHKQFSDKDTKYDDVVYAKLPAKIKNAVKTLGFTQETWDNHGWADSEEKWFEDLTPEELQAAETLGWDETAWDHQYENKDWDDLPEVVKKAAAATGFTKELWDDDEWPDALYKDWDELTVGQRRAMNVLGYHKWAW